MKFIIKYTILYLIMTASIIFACPHDKDIIITIQDQDKMESLLKNNMGPCLMYFYMNNCGWCSKIAPILEKLAESEQFCNTVTFYKINGPQVKASDLIKEHFNKKIIGYPTLFFMNQGKVIDTQIGGTTEEIIIKKLTTLLKQTKKN